MVQSVLRLGRGEAIVQTEADDVPEVRPYYADEQSEDGDHNSAALASYSYCCAGDGTM